MKDFESLHKKVQEHCDCFSTTDYLKEMSEVINDRDKQDGALKWLALSALHGVNQNAKKISIRKDKEGNVSVLVKYRPSELPSPGPEVADAIFETVRGITHIEEAKGKTALALGIRDSSLDLNIKVDEEDGQKTITLKFPK